MFVLFCFVCFWKSLLAKLHTSIVPDVSSIKHWLADISCPSFCTFSSSFSTSTRCVSLSLYSSLCSSPWNISICAINNWEHTTSSFGRCLAKSLFLLSLPPHNDETPVIFPLWSSSIISSVSPFYKQCSVLSICSPSLFVLEPASLKMTLCSCSFMFPSAFYSASSAPLSRQPLQCSSSRAPLWTTVNFFLNAFSFWTLSIDSAIHLSR